MRRVIGAFLTIGVLAGCDDEDDPTPPPPPDPEVFEWEATIAGEEGFEQIAGESSFTWTEDEDEFMASAQISGDEAEAVRPWHVHFNTCAEGGGIVGLDGDYDRLTVEEDGTASATSTVPFEIDPDESYHVNVHLSDEELGTIIACGDFTQVPDENGNGN